ncbi:hypothetical protein EXE25_09175 [Acinetobacter bouvetii]|uniref:Permuted papain-like amidase YaeF/Yiix C92 family enzyme n=1 Tax=Acinetobacter bouvetii TaxID=202951 RepID=A0A4Q7B1G4_9GAMM|nr:YiiX/YebB-like N1pC/P60 family cysteine hydrolase [Acinetobacter bouvetii]RZG66847.1 hypothetical protein EXE25_09175 [Acinetobacter bouvetii]
MQGKQKISKENKQEKYILKFSELMKPGDVILTAASTLSSIGIREITKSDFSHAILYIGNSYMHSDLNGVHSGNPQRLLFESPDHVKVLRLKKEYSSKVDMNKICSYARAKNGTQYSKLEAAKSVLSPESLKIKNRQFCSRLVAKAYYSAGVNIVKYPDYCTPHEISTSNFFEEVTDVIRLAEIEEIEFANSESFLNIHNSSINKLLEDVRGLTGNDIQTLNDIDIFLINNNQYDQAFTEILNKSGYLDIWKYDFSKNPWKYNGEIFLNYNFPSSELEKFKKLNEFPEATSDDLRKGMALGELKLFTGTTITENEGMKNQNQYNLYVDLYGKYKLKYFLTIIFLYKQLLNNCRRRIDAAKYVLRQYGVKIP